MTDWMAIGDTHGDLADPAAVDAAVAFAKRHKPAVRIHLGDVWDLRALRNNASDEERAEGIAHDIECGMNLIRKYKPTHLLLGNHDYRLWERAERCADGKLREYCRLLVDRILDELESIGCEVFPYDVERGIFKYGDRKFMHGYCHNLHSAHKAGMTYGNCTFGHVHAFQRARPVRDDGPVAWSCGHMMDANRAQYARRRLGTLRWEQGFMYGWNLDGHVTTFTIEPSGGKWVIPRGFK